MTTKTEGVPVQDTKYPIVGADGKPWTEGNAYVDPLDSGGKYLVRHYPVPPLDKISPLLKDFQQRFLHFVDRGYNVVKTSPEKLDAYIEHERKLLEDKTLPQADRELTERWLSTALVGRSMRHARYFQKLNASGDAPSTETMDRLVKIVSRSYEKDGEALERLKQNPLELLSAAITADTMEFYKTGATLRGKRGYLDADDLIGEAVGEQKKLNDAMTAEITNAMRAETRKETGLAKGDEILAAFFEGRYDKSALAMKEIDRTIKAVSDITARNPALQTLMKDMADAAKQKIHIQHGDDDYPAIDKRYVALRDEMQAKLGGRKFEIRKQVDGQKSDYMRAIMTTAKAQELADLNFLKQATDLIYDMSVTRGPRWHGVEELKLDIKAAELAQSQSRGR